MQRKFLSYYFLLLSSICIINCKADEVINEETCDPFKTLVNGECIDSCYTAQVCGNHTTCSSNGLTTYCSCKRGYSGNPLKDCFKMNEKSPCDPNPCGPNSECIMEDAEIGPHCKCKNGFYDWPPNCRTGCSSDNECSSTQICNRHNSCEELCGAAKCGENSICRVDKIKRTIHCSCKDGYIPRTDLGCTLKKPNEQDINLSSFMSILDDGCGGTCGFKAYCAGNGTCVCTQGYSGDAKNECVLIESSSVDPCNPNPCGGYSKCDVVDNEPKCSCIPGYGFEPPFCSKCNSNSDCNGDLCSNGRCVFNICKPHCGIDVACNIHDGKLECSCPIQAINEPSKPFESCPYIAFISAAVIATLSG